MAERFATWTDADDTPVTRYPWDQWTNGDVWLVQRDVDYSCQTDSFIAGLFGTARKMGLRVSVRSRTDGQVRFQFLEESDA